MSWEPNPISLDKRRLAAALARLADAPPSALDAALEELSAPDALWRLSHPMNEARGLEAVARKVWRPLKRAMPDLERRDLVFIGGDYQDRRYVAAMGHYCGTFARDWLGIPATGRALFLRYGEVYQIVAGTVVAAHCLWDVLDVMRQAGFQPIAPSLGMEGMWAGPITGDGLVMGDGDPARSAASLAQTLAMHATLGAYDDRDGAGRAGLLAMPQKDHWHPKMMWYGPAGIGTTRGLAGFVDHHQLPFREAFPNRKGGGQWDDIPAEKARLGGGHYIRVGDGDYSVTGGWPSVFARHSGGNFLGVGPTGRLITMRVMDFYHHHEGRIRENWVPLDLLDVLMQMGVDVQRRMKAIWRA